MKLNRLEFLLINSPIRSLVQKYYEMSRLVEMAGPVACDRVLEIGCGNGQGAALIREVFKARQITAIDLDEKMIQIARKRVRHERTFFCTMDAADLAFADASFDAIFDFGIIHHVPDWRKCLHELGRVLKPGGHLIMEDLSMDSFTGFPGGLYRKLLTHPYDQMFSTREFVDYLATAGFSIKEFEQRNPLNLVRYFSLVAAVQ